jgi:hypothetical protein
MQDGQKKLLYTSFFILFFISGCTDIQVKEERKTETGIGLDEKISFILDRSTLKDLEQAQEMEEKIERCLDKSLKKLEPPVQTVSAETFRNTAFPGMEYLSLPSSPDSILTYLKSPEFVKRLQPLNLRYLLVLNGESHTSPMQAGCEAGQSHQAAA